MNRAKLIEALELALAELKAEEPVVEDTADPTDEMISLSVSGNPNLWKEKPDLFAKMKPTYDPLKEPWTTDSWMLYGIYETDNRPFKPVEVQLDDGPVMARPCGDPSKGGWFANRKYWYRKGFFEHNGQWYKRVG